MIVVEAINVTHAKKMKYKKVSTSNIFILCFTNRSTLTMQDVWPQIFTYLHFKEMSACVWVCKLFHNLCINDQKNWKIMLKNNFGLSEIVEIDYFNTYAVFQKLKNLTKIIMDKYDVILMYNNPALCITYNNIPKRHSLPFLPNLYSLYLRNIDNSIPFDTKCLRNITHLDLMYNKLKYIPEEICELIELQALDISNNVIESLPASIGNLRNLTHLTMNGNKLTILPPEIGNLHELLKLQINRNNLYTLPPEIGNLYKLVQLYGYNNNIIKVPYEILKLINLKSLNLSNNFIFYGPDLNKLPNLTSININNNIKDRITGRFPSEFIIIATILGLITYFCKIVMSLFVFVCVITRNSINDMIIRNLNIWYVIACVSILVSIFLNIS